jgi:short-subunit dehydrogenase
VISALVKLQEPKPVDKFAGKGTTRGAIVMMGSAASYVATPRISQYNTSKHAVVGLVKSAGESPVEYFPSLIPVIEVALISRIPPI